MCQPDDVDHDYMTAAQHCSRIALVDLISERAAAPQTTAFDEGWVCTACLFYNAWPLTSLSTQPSKGAAPSASARAPPPRPPPLPLPVPGPLEAAAEAAAGAQDAPSISLKVVTPDGNEVHFQCKQTMPLQRLMHAYCNRQGVPMGAVRFLFDGNRIHEAQTPRDLDMEDGDVIDVMVEQQGGAVLSQ